MLIPENKQFDIWSKELTIPILALDIVIFTIYMWELCVVVSKTTEWQKMGYSIPGWIVAKWFDLEQNFDDILKRKTWIEWVYKEQLYTFWDPKRDPRGHVIAVCYYALVKVDSFLTKVDFTKVEILKYSEIEKQNFFYDHARIIHYAKQRLEWKLEYTNIAAQILPQKFKMSQLQWVYEIITGKKYDKRNFQKKIFSLNILGETWELDRSTNRPAKLYEFLQQEIQIVEKNCFV
jgi:8-oxo-dGTP diphosphatase